MKKIKLLAPLLTTITVSSSILPIVGCNITEPTHAYISDVANKKVEAQDVEVSSETKYNTARFYITLDESTYKLEDLTIKMIAQDTSNFVLEPFINDNILVLDIRTKTYINEEFNYKFDLEISHTDWTNKIEGCQIVFYKGGVDQQTWANAFKIFYQYTSDRNYTINATIEEDGTTKHKKAIVQGTKEYLNIVEDNTEMFWESSERNGIFWYSIINNKTELQEITPITYYSEGALLTPAALKTLTDNFAWMRDNFSIFKYDKKNKNYVYEPSSDYKIILELNLDNKISSYSIYLTDSKYEYNFTYNDAIVPTRPGTTTTTDVIGTSEGVFKKEITNFTIDNNFSAFRFKLDDDTFKFNTSKKLVFKVSWATTSTFRSSDYIKINFYTDSGQGLNGIQTKMQTSSWYGDSFGSSSFEQFDIKKESAIFLVIHFITDETEPFEFKLTIDITQENE